MLSCNNDRKQMINFLIQRWQLIIHSAALEKVYLSSLELAKKNNMQIPQKPIIMVPQACKQIEIIKQRIIAILPETKFIDYSFETQAPLQPNDFIEIFVADHYQCVEKVIEVVNGIK